MRKLLSVFLALMLLVTMAVPTLAVTNDAEPAETRTVEEILNEYHVKSFAADMAEETEGLVAYSNRGGNSGKTLEEETVDELRAAGYEAYNVTSSNYDSLEASLKTDFEEMGLDPNSSYIITVSGEPSSNARSIDPPTEDYLDGGGSGFLYEYNGNTYAMRYVTITPHDDIMLLNKRSVDVFEVESLTSAMLGRLEDVLNTGISIIIDGIAKYPISTIGSALGITIVDFPQEFEARITIHAQAKWTRKYTQVYQPDYESWSSYSSVDYVLAEVDVEGYHYNYSILDYVYPYYSYEFTKYSLHYSDTTWQKQNAAIGYEGNYRIHEYVGDVAIKENPEDENSRTLFTLYQLRLG